MYFLAKHMAIGLPQQEFESRYRLLKLVVPCLLIFLHLQSRGYGLQLLLLLACHHMKIRQEVLWHLDLMAVFSGKNYDPNLHSYPLGKTLLNSISKTVFNYSLDRSLKNINCNTAYHRIVDS